jgi:iron complex transport system substrate-binding protein
VGAGLLLAAAVARGQGPVVIDDAGQRLALGRPAQRIVSLAPHVTELLFAAGAGAYVVAVSRYSDHPAAARRLPQIGDSARVDLEAIAALRPDLVVAWGSALTPAVANLLARMQIPVFRSEPHTLEQIASNLERLGLLAGTSAAAGPAARAFRSRLQALRTAHAGSRPLSVFFQTWSDPLMTVNGQQVITDALAVCAGRNIFAQGQLLAPAVDPESVVAADPDAIVSGIEAGVTAATSPAFARWRSLPQLRAGLPGHLIALDADQIARPAPRILTAVETLCRALDRIRTPGARGADD